MNLLSEFLCACFARRFFVRYTQIQKVYLYGTLLQFVYIWPKIGRKNRNFENSESTFEKHEGELRWQKDFKMFHTTPFPFGLIWLLSVQTVVKQGLSVLTENVILHFFNATPAIEKKKRYQVEIMLLKQQTVPLHEKLDLYKHCLILS